jgi:hypothetical protein
MSVFGGEEVVIRVRRKRGRDDANDEPIVVGTKKAKIEDQLASLAVQDAQNPPTLPAVDGLKVFTKIATLQRQEDNDQLDQPQSMNAISRIKAAHDRQRAFKNPIVNRDKTIDQASQRILNNKKDRFYRTISQKRDDIKGINIIDLVDADSKEDEATVDFDDGYVWDIYVQDNQYDLGSLGESFVPQVVLYEYSHDFFFGVPDDHSDSQDSNRKELDIS